ncbi:MAG: hypothetical protein ACOX20_09945 [Limnochordia bacterium]
MAPPKLETSLEGPLGLGVKFERWDPVPFRITARVRNTVEAPTLIGSERNLAAPSWALPAARDGSKYVGNSGTG